MLVCRTSSAEAACEKDGGSIHSELATKCGYTNAVLIATECASLCARFGGLVFLHAEKKKKKNESETGRGLVSNSKGFII